MSYSAWRRMIKWLLIVLAVLEAISLIVFAMVSARTQFLMMIPLLGLPVLVMTVIMTTEPYNKG